MNYSYLAWFGMALAVSILMTPVLGRLARVIGIIDHPSQRKFHLFSTPLLGGVAISATSVVLAALALSPGSGNENQLIVVLCSGVAMMILGLMDDIRAVTPLVKLVSQAAITAALIFFGVHVSLSSIPAVNYILTLLWVVGIMNCLNLLDNIDGLSSGTSAIAGCFYFAAALSMGKPGIAMVAIIFSGACLGFLFHNFHPATIFSGDAGSMFMGTMLAALGLLLMEPGNLPAHMTPPIILGLLIFDTGLVVSMRLANGYSITDGGKDHTSHRLCNLGMNIQASVSTLFGVCILFGTAGIIVLGMEPVPGLVFSLVIILAMVVAAFLMKNLYDYSNHPLRKHKKRAPEPTITTAQSQQ